MPTNLDATRLKWGQYIIYDEGRKAITRMQIDYFIRVMESL